MIVTMTKSYSTFSQGMKLSFPDHVAEALIARGVAEGHPEPRKVEKTMTKPAKAVAKSE